MLYEYFPLDYFKTVCFCSRKETPVLLFLIVKTIHLVYALAMSRSLTLLSIVTLRVRVAPAEGFDRPITLTPPINVVQTSTSIIVTSTCHGMCTLNMTCWSSIVVIKKICGESLQREVSWSNLVSVNSCARVSKIDSSLGGDLESEQLRSYIDRSLRNESNPTETQSDIENRLRLDKWISMHIAARLRKLEPLNNFFTLSSTLLN